MSFTFCSVPRRRLWWDCCLSPLRSAPAISAPSRQAPPVHLRARSFSTTRTSCFLSLVSLMPTNTDTSLAAVIGLSAAAALVYSGFILVRVLRSHTTDLDDRLGYGAGPVAAYAAALAAAVLIFERWVVGPSLLAGALTLLLLVNIRNA